MADKKIFVVDRFEGSIAVCISDDDDVVKMPCDSLDGLVQNDVFSAIIDGEGLVDITPMPEERDRRLGDMRARLHALARRSKK
jgi:hypothetical protein